MAGSQNSERGHPQDTSKFTPYQSSLWMKFAGLWSRKPRKTESQLARVARVRHTHQSSIYGHYGTHTKSILIQNFNERFGGSTTKKCTHPSKGEIILEDNYSGGWALAWMLPRAKLQYSHRPFPLVTNVIVTFAHQKDDGAPRKKEAEVIPKTSKKSLLHSLRSLEHHTYTIRQFSGR